MIKFGKLIFLITFFAMLAQGVFFFYKKPDELMAIPLILILGGVAAYWLGRNKTDEDAQFQLNIFLIAFSIRLLTGMFIYGWDFMDILGDEDASGYLGAWTLAKGWYFNGLDAFISDFVAVFFERVNTGQSLIWGIPMFIAGGPSRMIVSVINSFAGALLVLVIYRISKRIFGSATARTAAMLVTFWASIILFSAGTSKEILAILFSWTLLYLAVRNPRSLTLKDGLFAIPAFLAVYTLRFYEFYMIAAAYMFRIILTDRRHWIRNLILGGIVVGGLMVFLNSGGVITRDFERMDRQNTGIQDWRTSVAASTGSGINVYSDYQNGSVAVSVATVYFFLAPFPWEITAGGLRNVFAVIENLVILVILIIGFPAMKIFFKDKFFEMAPIFVFCGMYAAFHIWGLANVGLAWRHKQTVMPLFFMLVALSLAHRKESWRIISQKLARRDKQWKIMPTN